MQSVIIQIIMVSIPMAYWKRYNFVDWRDKFTTIFDDKTADADFFSFSDENLHIKSDIINTEAILTIIV